jgi:hypothetical protein
VERWESGGRAVRDADYYEAISEGLDFSIEVLNGGLDTSEGIRREAIVFRYLENPGQE